MGLCASIARETMNVHGSVMLPENLCCIHTHGKGCLEPHPNFWISFCIILKLLFQTFFPPIFYFFFCVITFIFITSKTKIRKSLNIFVFFFYIFAFHFFFKNFCNFFFLHFLSFPGQKWVFTSILTIPGISIQVFKLI